MLSNTEITSDISVVTSNIISHYEKRQELIEKVINSCVKYRLDGININFKNIRPEDKEAFTRFIIELTPRLKEIGLVCVVTISSTNDTELLPFDILTITNTVDYVSILSNNEYGISNISKQIDENKLIFSKVLDIT